MKRYCVILFSLLIIMPSFGFAFSRKSDDFIKWVDFNPSYEIMQKVFATTNKYKEKENNDFSFVRALSYLATKNGNKFKNKEDEKNLIELTKRVDSGEKIDDIYAGNKYYNYNVRVYSAIFAGFFKQEQNTLALAAYFPIAKGHWYTHYDDFGSSRSFGYKRKHLGHDMMGQVGAPIMAVEGGVVTELGWNMYGGWRVGVRSNDGLRFWYYAHLRKDNPYVEGLIKGKTIAAGEHIGYLGRTGFSRIENTNLKTGASHLHIGLQLIFDKSQEKGSKEIWIDVYQITKFLIPNRKAV